MARGTSDRRSVGLKYGFRSGLEEKVAKQLTSQGVDFEFETRTVHYVKPARAAKYIPDFILPNGIIIETKGRFVTADRQKHLLLQEQHPGLDIRFVFSNPNARISKQSATTYGMWCLKHDFLFDKQYIPQRWLEEADCDLRWEAIHNAGIKT